MVYKPLDSLCFGAEKACRRWVAGSAGAESAVVREGCGWVRGWGRWGR